MDMDDDLELLGISGKTLLAIRDLIGWSRSMLSDKMRQVDTEGAPCSEASILRNERKTVVPLLFARCYRAAIGPQRFDKLLDHVRRNGKRSHRDAANNDHTNRETI